MTEVRVHSSSNPFVAAIVVTYNRLELLKEGIVALQKQTYNHLQIIVVNNGSTDGTTDWLATQSDVLTLTQDNVGGAGGFFTGMKYAAEHDFDFVWIMDDDVIPRPDALEELIHAYFAKPDIGFVCSQVVGLDDKPMNIPEVDPRVTHDGSSAFYDLAARGMIKVSKATFVSLLIAGSTLREFGLPIKEYFIWGDDTEFTLRISLHRDSYLVTSSVVLHKRSLQTAVTFLTETNPTRLGFYFYMYRNSDHTNWPAMTWKHKTAWAFNRTFNLIALLLRGDFHRFRILLRATFALAHFQPEIQFPHPQKTDHAKV